MMVGCDVRRERDESGPWVGVCDAVGAVVQANAARALLPSCARRFGGSPTLAYLGGTWESSRACLTSG